MPRQRRGGLLGNVNKPGAPPATPCALPLARPRRRGDATACGTPSPSDGKVVCPRPGGTTAHSRQGWLGRRAGPGDGSEGTPGSPNSRRLCPLLPGARVWAEPPARWLSPSPNTQKPREVAFLRLVTVTSGPRFPGAALGQGDSPDRGEGCAVHDLYARTHATQGHSPGLPSLPGGLLACLSPPPPLSPVWSIPAESEKPSWNWEGLPTGPTHLLPAPPVPRLHVTRAGLSP